MASQQNIQVLHAPSELQIGCKSTRFTQKLHLPVSPVFTFAVICD